MRAGPGPAPHNLQERPKSLPDDPLVLPLLPPKELPLDPEPLPNELPLLPVLPLL